MPVKARRTRVEGSKAPVPTRSSLRGTPTAAVHQLQTGAPHEPAPTTTATGRIFATGTSILYFGSSAHPIRVGPRALLGVVRGVPSGPSDCPPTLRLLRPTTAQPQGPGRPQLLIASHRLQFEDYHSFSDSVTTPPRPLGSVGRHTTARVGPLHTHRPSRCQPNEHCPHITHTQHKDEQRHRTPPTKRAHVKRTHARTAVPAVPRTPVLRK